MVKSRQGTIINHNGQEWRHGGQYRVSHQPYGFIIARRNQNAKDILFHISDMAKELTIGEDYSPDLILKIISPDIFVARQKISDHHFVVYSISEDRILIPDAKKIIKYDTSSKLISLISLDNHLQLRDHNNTIIEDFGVFPTMGYGDFQSLPEGVLVSDNDAELMITKKYKGQSVFVSVNVMTGREYGEPYLAIGPVYEGVRYMIRPDGSECFVDINNEFLFNLLPCVPRDLRHLGTSLCNKPTQYGNLRNFCCNGRIIADYRRQDGKIQSYMLDRDGNILLPPGKCPTSMYSLGANRYAVRRRNDIAIANEKGELLTDFIYKTVSSMGMSKEDTSGIGFFSDNRCAMTIKIRSKYYTGCIDSDCNVIIPFDFARIGYFALGFAYAERHMRGVDYWG